MKIHMAEAGRTAAWRSKQALWLQLLSGGIHTSHASAEAIDRATWETVSEKEKKNPVENVKGCLNIWHGCDHHAASPDPASSHLTGGYHTRGLDVCDATNVLAQGLSNAGGMYQEHLWGEGGRCSGRRTGDPSRERKFSQNLQSDASAEAIAQTAITRETQTPRLENMETPHSREGTFQVLKSLHSAIFLKGDFGFSKSTLDKSRKACHTRIHLPDEKVPEKQLPPTGLLPLVPPVKVTTGSPHLPLAFHTCSLKVPGAVEGTMVGDS